MSTATCRTSPAARLLAAALPALICLAPTAARANDRDLRATTVPASSCAEYGRVNFTGQAFTPDGDVSVTSALGYLALVCPLPVSNVDLSGTTNDNDISRYRVLYTDPNGAGAHVGVTVDLHRMTADGLSMIVCRWSSNSGGSGATGPTSAVAPCAHDVAAGALYHFQVTLLNDHIAASAVEFRGITFP